MCPSRLVAMIRPCRGRFIIVTGPQRGRGAGSIPAYRSPYQRGTMMELPKGTRDFMPEDKILRDDIVKTLKKNFELFGYNPLETPALEMYETLASKYAGGGEKDFLGR